MYIDEEVIIILGNFDGVHLGHRKLLAKAKELNLPIAIITFDTHPKMFFGVENFKLIFTKEEKRKIFETLGVDYYIELPFEEIISFQPIEFINYLKENINSKCIVAGIDCKFGAKGLGDIHLLQQHFENVIVVNFSVVDDKKISSTNLREHILNNDFQLANKMLLQPFFIEGIVEVGKQIGGKFLFPTVNITPDESKLLPLFGVYCTKTTIKGQIYKSVTNIGCCPTVDGKKVIVETHILDFNEDVYGKSIKIEFYEFIRQEQKFESLEHLKQQLMKDIKFVEKYKYEF